VRLDLFLKTSRLVKRRSVAQEMCETGGVVLNGHVAKSSREVRVGDCIMLRYASRIIEVEVLDVPLSTKRQPQVPPVRIIAETRTPADQDL
jgi:ribosomal 50S subunit-recycling heat shock protein